MFFLVQVYKDEFSLALYKHPSVPAICEASCLPRSPLSSVGSGPGEGDSDSVIAGAGWSGAQALQEGCQERASQADQRERAKRA